MRYKYRNRYIIVTALIAVTFLGLILGLYFRTTASADSSRGDTNFVRMTSKAGRRGPILDINGTQLAYDVSVYNVQFLKDVSKNNSSDRANYTQSIIKAVGIIEKNGSKTIDTFNIVFGQNGTFSYDFGDISVQLEQQRIKNWLSNMAVPENMTDPEEVYYELRNRYRIPEEMGYDDARKILSIWQESQLTGMYAYEPVTIATDVSYETIAEIEVMLDQMDGISVDLGSKRYYPYSELAAHLLGYTGRISDPDQLEELSKKGYTESSLIGKIGLEYSLEEHLSGEVSEKRGYTTFRIDSTGSVKDIIGKSDPKSGDTVVLNIDLDLERVVMEALENNVTRVRAEQEEEYNKRLADDKLREEMLEELGDREPDFCNSGAAIVVDIDTLDVRAICSYPSFDLNEFVGGISADRLREFTEDEATPLFDRTIQSRSTPGSIFKLLTAVAGLMENEVTLGETIDDRGPFTKYITDGSDAPKCWTKYYSNHKAQNVVKAIKNSCNYYFFVVADRLKIDRIHKWAEYLGLTSKTGIELPYETAGFVGDQKTLYDSSKDINEQITSMPRLVYNAVRKRLKAFGAERNMEYSSDKLSDAAEKIVALAGTGSSKMGDKIRKVLQNILDIPEAYSSNKGWDNELNALLLELIWDGTDTVTTGIGTNITQLTPIAVVRYLATILNGGKLMVPHLVNRIVSADGKVVSETEKEVLYDLEIRQEFIDAVKEGMKEVTLTTDGGGTAAKVFRDFRYLEQFGGKSGTAPVSNFDLEDNGWFISFAPYDEPEIAIVVFLPHGASGSNAAYAVRDILEYYFDRIEDSDRNGRPVEKEGSMIP
ncbi:MAG: hypothetical protein IKI74_01270 [Christensenellaceae bacterium]|nr:hypothetical protein [Christensenellaceae bacterium]